MELKIQFDRNRLIELCKQYGVKRLAFFGSAVREDFGPHSDIDILVGFRDDRTPTLLDLGGFRESLVELFQREVDIVTYKSLSNPLRRASILEDERVEYVEAG